VVIYVAPNGCGLKLVIDFVSCLVGWRRGNFAFQPLEMIPFVTKRFGSHVKICDPVVEFRTDLLADVSPQFCR
jgi:hypothetical protein